MGGLLRLLPALLAAGSALGAEYVVLENGFRVQAERHEVAGDVVHLFTGGGRIDLPASSVAAFEPMAADAAPAGVPKTAKPPAAPDPRELLDQAADRYGIPREFLRSVAAVESSLQPDAVSPKGAIGVMQLMPTTAALLDADPHDTAQNIDAGARHLRDLLLRYDGGVYHALAAYNAGAEAVDRYQGIPPYRETRLYVQKVLDRFQALGGKSQ